eukprot:symbB.v1.2.041590.t1/scaffold8381.1/size6581/1
MAKRSAFMGRRSRVGTALALCVALCAFAQTFVVSRGAAQLRDSSLLRRAEATETETKPVKRGPSEEAIKTRSIFMSLDSDEFGIDEEQIKKAGIPTEET